MNKELKRNIHEKKQTVQIAKVDKNGLKHTKN
jgi:hypothetical protein